MGARLAQRLIVRFIRELSGRSDIGDAAAAWKWLKDAVREADSDVASNLPPVRRDVLTAWREGARTVAEIAERTGYTETQVSQARSWLVTAGLVEATRRQRETV
jgi:DNA-binding transcriptional ArsR family regulator